MSCIKYYNIINIWSIYSAYLRLFSVMEIILNRLTLWLIKMTAEIDKLLGDTFFSSFSELLLFLLERSNEELFVSKVRNHLVLFI